MDQKKRSKFSGAASAGLYILIAFSITSLFFWTASPVSNAQHYTSGSERPDVRPDGGEIDEARHDRSLIEQFGADLGNAEISVAGYHADELPELAAAVVTTITGRLATAQGRSLGHAEITLTEEEGNVKKIAADSFGYLRFTEIRAHQKVTIAAVGNGYACTPATLYVVGISSANFTCEIDSNAKAAKAKLPAPPVCEKAEITDRNLHPPVDSDRLVAILNAELQGCRSSE
jgi:hypothetical protein